MAELGEGSISDQTANGPIIVIGMHRSGTSMLSRMLRGMGVFMGWRRQESEEALFFLRVNEWLLDYASSTWMSPAHMSDVTDNEEIRSLVTERVEMIMASFRILSYMGPEKFLRYGNVKNLPVPFGWKDPRNTFTLPLWLDIFPNARIIHVCRHGIDVASSLREREIRRIKSVSIRNQRDKRQRRHWLRPMPRMLNAPGFLSLEFGLSVWSEYVSEARKHLKQQGTRGLEIEFEEFLRNPNAMLSRVAAFCGLEVDEETLNGLASTINKDRAFGYLRSSELCELAERMHDMLVVHGYGSVQD